MAGEADIYEDWSRPPADNAILTVVGAAFIARRSTKTLRRAYRRGLLKATRDGNGRLISIEYRDLRAWMQADDATGSRTAAAPVRPSRSDLTTDHGSGMPDNLKLLDEVTKDIRSRRRR
jgi:hypothetical protein